MRTILPIFITLAGAVALCAMLGCSARNTPPQYDDTPLFDGVGAHTRQISTENPTAQRYFNQGLVWSYAFNHDEAIRSFRMAARHDPNCAMTWWGVALCYGPHINFPMMTPEQSAAAWDALQQAVARAPGATPVERELIAALERRYVQSPPETRTALDEDYAKAMGALWAKYPDDSDVGALYAEALMNLQPWDFWTPGGSPKGRTPLITEVLEAVLARDAEHPGANHLYIHLMEASPHPEKAIASADRLRESVPISGHLVHMPSHIDVQVGRWALAADQNERAIKADERYQKAAPPRQGFYRAYMAHNHHFLAWAAMMEGRRMVALRAAREMIANFPPAFVKANPAIADPFMMIELDVLKRFGMWDDILRVPQPPEYLPLTRAHWHFARGLALAARKNFPAAREEQVRFRDAVEAFPPGMMFALNKADDVFAIADFMLDAEIAFQEGRVDEAIEALEIAVEREDALRYIEAPEWIQPVRHTLGAFLIAADRYEEAEAVYRKDLEIWPENGWSLFGLAQALDAQNRPTEASTIAKRFNSAWSRAEIKPGATCLCVEGKAKGM